MKNNLKVRVIALAALLTLLASIAGCGASEDEIQKGRVTVTISYSEEDSTRDTLVAIKEKFPDIDIRLLNNSFISDDGDFNYDYLEYLSTHGGLADITLSSSLSKGLPSLTDSFADLSGKAYTSRFKTSYLNDTAIGGAVYYLPFTLQVEGIIYNKTLFDEQGWSAPANYEEFAALLKTIHDTTDIRPLYDENHYKTVSYWWNTYYALNDGSHVSGYKQLKQFNDGELTAAEMRTANTFAYMKLLCDTGALLEEDLSTLTGTLERSPDAYRVLGSRGAAMAFASSLTLKQLKVRWKPDEFEMIPLYTTDCPEGYLLEKPSVNLAVSNAAASDPEKDAAIDRIMDYITGEEGQQQLLEYTYGIKSPCYGIMDAYSRTYLDKVIPAMNSGYLITPGTFEHLDSTMDETFLNYLFHNENGELQPADVLRAIDQSRQSALAARETDSAALTVVTEDFTWDQTKYLLCMAMARQTGCDFAVLPNMQYNNYYGTLQRSESIMTNLLAGTLSADDIRSFIYMDSHLKTYKITGSQLLKLLDYNSSGYILYGAVLTYTYNEEKDTYYTTGATMPDGCELDLSKTYTITASAHSDLGESVSKTASDTGVYLTNALIEYCRGEQSLSPIEIPEPVYINS